jgi:hypothetical protein
MMIHNHFAQATASAQATPPLVASAESASPFFPFFVLIWMARTQVSE